MTSVRAPPSGAGPPPATRSGSSRDNYHGTLVADPYRWLEAADSREVRAWVDEQNAYARRALDPLPGRVAFAARVRQLLDIPRLGLPDSAGGRYAYRYNAGLAETDALWITTDLDQPGRLVMDPLALRADGTVSLGDFVLNPAGDLVAYSLSDGGSDWRSWRFRRTDDGSELPERITGTRFTGLAFSADGTRAFYSRYPRRPDGSFDDTRPVSILAHRLGTDVTDDETAFAVTGSTTRNPYGQVSEDGRWLVIRIDDGYETNALYSVRLTPAGELAGPVRRHFDAWDARYEYVGSQGDELYVLTTRSAPRGRIMALRHASDDAATWREVVPESGQIIEAARLVGGQLVVSGVADVRSTLTLYPLTGGPGRTVGLPGEGTVSGVSGRGDGPDAWFLYSDFVTPRTLYRLRVADGSITPVRPPAAASATDFRVLRTSYRGRDGTPIPVTAVQRTDRAPGRPQPTVLYGYGGFNVSLLPAWSPARMAWIEAGGTYVQANLRGGGEFGEAWHRAGTRLRKQTVFDDFIAAAEWLIATGQATPASLGIWGGSNGGLLVGAVLNQRPELFGAAVPAVGVMDMLRYHTASLNARQWSSDYGLSENPDEFRALVAYSPVHNVRRDRCYPPVLVQADANDDRVVPWHSYKYAAMLQAAMATRPDCPGPILLRTETRSGHGAGASTSKIVAEYADQWAFMAAALGLPR